MGAVRRVGLCACAIGVGFLGGASLAHPKQAGEDSLELVQVVFRHGGFGS